MTRWTLNRWLLPWALALLVLVPLQAVAQDGDEEFVEEEELMEEPLEDEFMEGEEPLEDELYYNDGIDSTWVESSEVIPEENPYIWGMRDDEGSLTALAYDIINDTLPPEMELHPWDLPSVDDADLGPPTAESIRAKLEDETFSPLRQVLAEGPIEGNEVRLMVLVPDTVLDQARTTQGIPDIATLKAVSMADQLTNGLRFTYTKRSNQVALAPNTQNTIPQLQYLDAKLYDGVVQFYFNMGLDSALYAKKQSATRMTGGATIASASISDGYDRAREAAIQQAVRRAISEKAQGNSQPLGETVTGIVEFFEITNEGYDGEAFTVDLTAWVTVDSVTGTPTQRPAQLASDGSLSITLDGTADDDPDTEIGWEN